MLPGVITAYECLPFKSRVPDLSRMSYYSESILQSSRILSLIVDIHQNRNIEECQGYPVRRVIPIA